MNLILIEPSEVGPDRAAVLSDRRAVHIRTVLRAEPGDVLRVGLVDGPLGTGVVSSVNRDNVTLVCAFDSKGPPELPPLDLLLALPRPKVLKRFWPVLASFGVRRVGLVNAEKVERVYFDSHVLEPGFIRAQLLEGCEQAGWTRLPRVTVHRRFRPFIEDELAEWSADTRRIVAHPGTGARIRDVVKPDPAGVLLAVGPEGGWNGFELDLLESHGFQAVGLAGGALRSDVACIALMAVVRDCQRTVEP